VKDTVKEWDNELTVNTKRPRTTCGDCGCSYNSAKIFLEFGRFKCSYKALAIGITKPRKRLMWTQLKMSG